MQNLRLKKSCYKNFQNKFSFHLTGLVMIPTTASGHILEIRKIKNQNFEYLVCFGDERDRGWDRQPDTLDI